jgi:polar amino acid transport system substrate-binding protein
MTYDAAVETQLALLASAGRLEVVNDFETVFGKLEMGRAAGTLATPPIYTKYLKSAYFKDRALVIPMPETTSRFAGAYLSKKNITPGSAGALHDGAESDGERAGHPDDLCKIL